MCVHMMSGQLYSTFPAMPLLLLGILLSAMLLVVVIWSIAVFLHGKPALLGRSPKPQPHDEPYTYSEPHEPALQVLRERYVCGEIDP